jgi:xylan 1,4-beta-xylosidase
MSVKGCRLICFQRLPLDLAYSRAMRTRLFPLLALAAVFAIPRFGAAQARVEVRVDAGEKVGTFKPIYAYFGYDEANYTYTPNGKKLIGELAALTDARVQIRTHFLLATGDGTPGLKWSSTGVYTEDAAGNPKYDWTIFDRILDTYVQAHARPFVEIGFMPEALSAKPEPYQVPWIPGAPNKEYSAGWSYPPKDFAKWSELVYQMARHCAERYGKEEAESWFWEVWNEPDIPYWHGTQEEYNELYDYAAAGVKRALPNARVGGPATTGPARPQAGEYLHAFLEHCAEGKNYATGATGAPLDFVSFHAKGSPEVVNGHVRMGIARNLQDVDAGMKILGEFAKFRELPVIVSESDPEGCAACSAKVYPQNAYRNGPLYAAYTAAALKGEIELAARDQIDLEGMLTWAFAFEGQDYFAGFRTLATNGVDKPILNLFRMAGMMSGDRVEAASSGAVPLETLLTNGVRGKPDVDVLAARDERGISILLWNYHDDDVSGPSAPIVLSVEGVPPGAEQVALRHYRIDAHHSNGYAAWKEMGAPQRLSPAQQRELEAEGQLELLDASGWLANKNGKVVTEFDLPRQGVSLVRLEW